MSIAGSRPIGLQARYVLPMAGPVIDGGIVTLLGERILSVGKRSDASEVRDLGDVAILPGLVNAHTHLEFSDLANPLGEPAMGFAKWIAQVTASRGRSTQTPAEASRPAEPAPSSVYSATSRGLAESRGAGVTTVGEIAVTGWSPEAFAAAPQDGVIFRELICLSPERIPSALAAAREHLATPAPANWVAGISPHAPYTVHPTLFAQAIDLAVEYDAPVAFHLAESPDELELLRSGTGPFFDYLSARGFWIPDAIPANTRPMDYLRQLARAPKGLVVHGNLLDSEERQFLTAHRDRLSVVYCPRTHAFFGRPRHPLEQLLGLGARVAVGTDSRASNPDLSLLAELRAIAEAFPQLARQTILRMGTMDGAEALGLDDSVGSLAPGKIANLAVVPLKVSPQSDPYAALLDTQYPCIATMCRGQWFSNF